MEPRVTRLQTMASFDDKLANKTSRTSIKAKPHLEAMPDKKPGISYTLDLKKTNSNLRAKIWQDTDESNNLKQKIKQLPNATLGIDN